MDSQYTPTNANIANLLADLTRLNAYLVRNEEEKKREVIFELTDANRKLHEANEALKKSSTECSRLDGETSRLKKELEKKDSELRMKDIEIENLKRTVSNLCVQLDSLKKNMNMQQGINNAVCPYPPQ